MSADETLGEAIEALAETIAARAGADPASSYTASLLAAGVERCAKKFGEEAVETVIAAMQGDRAALTREAADVLFHLVTLLKAAGVSGAMVAEELKRRRGTSGHAEKAGRGG